MENSSNVFFGEGRAQWYVALGSLGERHVGPLKAEDIYQKVLAGELTWSHFAWETGGKEWRRLSELVAFQAAVPRKPTEPCREITPASVGAQKAPPPPMDSDDNIWFLYYNQSQFGPFSAEEIARLLLVGRIHGRVHAWRNGMQNWERLERIREFSQVARTVESLPPAQTERGEPVVEEPSVRIERDTRATGQASSAAPVQTEVKAQPVAREEKPREKPEDKREQKQPEPAPKDKRSAPRAPLVAKIVMADDRGVSAGVCRDISIGGMQVLTDQLPGEVGHRIRLNVSAIPDYDDAARSQGQPQGQQSLGKIEPFVAEGRVVRILEDKRGFSFRFDKLSDAAKQAIQQYIEQSAS